jgi:S-DNA-T family DNA segregation ATPase FtsK/SpoIIIE
MRYSFVVLLAGAVALAWLSLLSYSPADPPSKAIYPPKNPVDNAAGIVGAYVAHTLRYWLGGGVYMGLVFATVAAFIWILGGRITALLWRGIGVGLLVTASSAAVHLIKPMTPDGFTTGPAGILGTAVGGFLVTRFNPPGAWLILVISLCIGLLLAAENLVLQLPRLGRKAWDKRGEIPAVVGAICAQIPLPGIGELAEDARDSKASKPPKAERPTPAKQAPPPAPKPVVEAKPAPAAKPAAEKPAAPAPASVAVAAIRAVLPKALPKPVEKSKDSGEDHSPPKGDGKGYVLPSTDLLAEPSGNNIESREQVAIEKLAVLQQTLIDFNVEAQVVGHMTGPVITMYELSLAPGVKVAQVANLANDIARALAVPGVRVVSPLPNKDTIGIEVPNLQKEIVRIRELMSAAPDADKRMRMPLYLGKDAGSAPIVADLASMPHMLIAGTTGSGKSVCINSIIMALLMTRTPEQVRLILIDPKMVEMAAFESVPHLLCPIVNDMKRAEDILEWAATKMDERYEVLKEAGVKNIVGYNRLGKEELYQRFGANTEEERKLIPLQMPYYVIIVDELADLIMTSSKDVEGHIIRIAQKARAVGIHLILATQRPSANVVTGLIRSNMPCRISFRVASRLESRIVLDQNGAEVLLGQGDMLFLQPGTSSLIRAQGSFIDDGEIRTVVNSLKAAGEPQYNSELMRLNTAPGGEDSGEKDELFDPAVEIVLASQRGSVSLLQRRMQIGYSRASRIIDQMAEAGLLGDYKGSQARECLITLDDWRTMKASMAADHSGDSSLNGEPTSV